MRLPRNDSIKIISLKKKAVGVKVAGGLIALALIIVSAVAIVMIIVNNAVK